MASTTTTSLNNQISQYWVDKALITLINNTPLYDVAVKTPLPKGYGNIVYWNAWNRLAGASVVLAEGGSNTAVAASSRRVTATIAQYGRAVTITDLAEYMAVLDTQSGVQQRLRDSAKETMEFICHMGIFKNVIAVSNSTTGVLSAYMSSLASSFCANTGTSGSSRQFQFPVVFGTSCARLSAVSKTAPSISATASLYSVRKATRRLRVQNALPFANGRFFGYAHTNFIHTLKRDPQMVNWMALGGALKETMWVGQVGNTDGVDWVTSNLCPRYAAAAHSVNLTFICGQEAFGVTEALGGLEMYLVTGADSSNIYNTLSTISYKISAAAAALNPSAGVILATHEFI
jgi:N4-gp56 family major capsid protein